MSQYLTVETEINAPLETVWGAFIDPEAIKMWNAASDDWHTTDAKNDFRVGGHFSSRMEARDGSEGFDFSGTYDVITPHERIEYTLDDGRKVIVVFSAKEAGVRVVEQFEPETENSHELQQTGWQAILTNFKKYVESL